MSATVEFLGLSPAELAAEEPARWTPETRETALRRLRALGGAQIRLHGGDSLRGGGKNVVLCGRERTKSPPARRGSARRRTGPGALTIRHISRFLVNRQIRQARQRLPRRFM